MKTFHERANCEKHLQYVRHCFQCQSLKNLPWICREQLSARVGLMNDASPNRSLINPHRNVAASSVNYLRIILQVWVYDESTWGHIHTFSVEGGLLLLLYKYVGNIWPTSCDFIFTWQYWVPGIVIVKVFSISHMLKSSLMSSVFTYCIKHSVKFSYSCIFKPTLYPISQDCHYSIEVLRLLG